MAALFDVVPAELRTGAANLAEDSGDLTGAAGEAGAAISSAAAAVPGGALAAALAGLGQQVGQRCTALAAAITAASTTVGANAARYEGDDAGAAGALGRQVPL